MERSNNTLVKSAPRWSLQLRSFLGSSELISQLSVELITQPGLGITGTPGMYLKLSLVPSTLGANPKLASSSNHKEPKQHSYALSDAHIL